MEDRHQDRHQRGVERIRRGLRCGQRNELESGVMCLIEGLSLLDEDADPRLTLCVFHNLTLFLANLELTVLARAVLVRSKPLYRQIGDPIMLARLLWLEGTVARLDGRPNLAARKLQQARVAFTRIDMSQAMQVRDELAEVQRQSQAAAV